MDLAAATSIFTSEGDKYSGQHGGWNFGSRQVLLLASSCYFALAIHAFSYKHVLNAKIQSDHDSDIGRQVGQLSQ